MQEFGTGFQYLLLILARVMGVFFTAPVFGAESIGYRLRMTLAFFISVILYPVVSKYFSPIPAGPIPFVLAIASQATVGILIGFMMGVIFSAFQAAGYIFSIQMGLSFSEVLDPQSQISSPVIGTLKGMVALILFLTVDFKIDGVYVPAYLHLIRTLAESFRLVPEFLPTAMVLSGIVSQLDKALGVMFLTALKIGIPIMGILFITSVALGLLGRAAPQMNLINMGIQINIFVGLTILIILSPVIIPIMLESFYQTYDMIGELLRDWPVKSGVQ